VIWAKSSWNGHHEKACEALGRIASETKDATVLNKPAMEAGAKRLVARCTELRAYIESNEGALIDYGQRSRAGKPISTSRAEGTVNQLVSARMNKRRQMRWSPRGAHRVLQVRAAVLDGRFGHQAIPLAA
jgi:UDP-N-acetylmuramate-alanine ligase